MFKFGTVIVGKSDTARSGFGGVFTFVAICALISGCAGGGGKRACSKQREYQASETTGSLTVPNNLDEPDRSGKLIIPEVREEDEEPAGDQPCLDQPPDYFERKL